MEKIKFYVWNLGNGNCRIVAHDIHACYRKMTDGAIICDLETLLTEMERIRNEVELNGNETAFIYLNAEGEIMDLYTNVMEIASDIYTLTGKMLESEFEYTIPPLEISFNGKSVKIPLNYAEFNNEIQGFLKDLSGVCEEYEL